MSEKFPINIPTELRELTEQCIKAQAAYGQMMHLLTQAISASSAAPENTMAAGFKEIQDRAMAFAKENADSSFAMATDLAKANDLEEVLAIQGRYAQQQIKTYARQVQELGQMTSKTIGSGPQSKQ